jgi:UDP-glucose 4-epimerase
MAILVAGGAGYIGSHVCKMLNKRGYEIIVYDNLVHGYRQFARWGEFILGSTGDLTQLDLVFSNYRIDAVMHFCAFIEVGESVTDPEKYYINNLRNTINLLDAMNRHKVNKIIFSSTAAVYGMPERIPIEEDDRKIPINPYGKTKWMIEHILEDYSSAYGIQSIRFRYFNAAGADPDREIGEAHIPESHLIPLVLDAAAGKRDSIKIFGTDYETSDGTCIRDYVHVNDLADAHIKGVQYLLDGGKTDYFNLGVGNGFSVRDVIETVKRVTKRDFKIVETERRPGDPAYLIAKSDKVKSKLDWKIEFGLEEMVRTAWNWHKIRIVSTFK